MHRLERENNRTTAVAQYVVTSFESTLSTVHAVLANAVLDPFTEYCRGTDIDFTLASSFEIFGWERKESIIRTNLLKCGRKCEQIELMKTTAR